MTTKKPVNQDLLNTLICARLHIGDAYHLHCLEGSTYRVQNEIRSLRDDLLKINKILRKLRKAESFET